MCTRYNIIYLTYSRRRRGDGRAAGDVRVAPRRRDCRDRKPNSAMRSARMARTRRNDARRRYYIYVYTYVYRCRSGEGSNVEQGIDKRPSFRLIGRPAVAQWAGRARARVDGIKSSGALRNPLEWAASGHPRVLPAISCARRGVDDETI